MAEIISKPTITKVIEEDVVAERPKILQTKPEKDTRIPTHVVVVKIYSPGEPPHIEMAGQFSGNLIKLILRMIPAAYGQWKKEQVKIITLKSEIALPTASTSEAGVIS